MIESVNVVTGKLETKSLRPPSLHTTTKEELVEYFENSYTLNEWIFLSLKDEKSFYLCPDRLRLPLIFYYCHTAAVYVNKLLLAGLIKERVNKTFESLFETGVDEMSWDDTENYRMGGNFKWPSLSEVVNYRKKVREIVVNLIKNADDYKLPITQDSPWWSVWMGMEHERIHIETSSVLIRQLPINMVTKPKGWIYAPVSNGEEVIENPMIKHPGGVVELGKEDENPGWGWDNEYGKLMETIPDFDVSTYKVTNRQMLEFIRDGGYNKQELWSEDGWMWRNFRKVVHPPFWICDQECQSNCGAAISTHSHCKKKQTATNGHSNGGSTSSNYRYRLMFDEIPLPLDWPVEVNFHEAKAFCRWKGEKYRLLSELEHNICRQLPPFTDVSTDPVFDPNSHDSYNHNLAFGSSTPVNFYPPTSHGLFDTMGNVWDWCEDHFNGFDGFKTHRFYEDFSSNTFDGRHHLILGGSWVSTGNEASRFARYAFRAHFIQHAGFRLARSRDDNRKTLVRYVDPEPFTLENNIENGSMKKEEKLYGVRAIKYTSSNYNYQTDTRSKVHKLLTDEYNKSMCQKVNTQITQIARNTTAENKKSKTLLIGCRSGKTAFELSSFCDQVVAVDTSSRAIEFANKLKKSRTATYTSECPDEKPLKISLRKDQETENIEFYQLTWLPCELADFDLVINIISDRVSCPQAWLLRTKELIHEQNGEGLGVVASKEWNGEKLREVFTPELNLISSEIISLDGEQVHITTWN